MNQRSFTGQIFTNRIEGGQSKVDIEVARSGISAMTTTGQLFEITFSQCQLRFGGVGRRLVFCRNSARTLTLCCAEPKFSQALSEASHGIMAAQIERQLTKRQSVSRGDVLLALRVACGIAMCLIAALLIARV